MKTLITFIALFVSCGSFAQNKPLTYSTVLQADSLTKTQIFDKALVWCAEVFENSNFAIRVKERDAGLIAGAAYMAIKYMVPRKKDSTIGFMFYKYYFDWKIEAKDGKARFSIENVETETSNEKFAVTDATVPDIKYGKSIMERATIEYGLSKKTFLMVMEDIGQELAAEINKAKKDSW